MSSIVSRHHLCHSACSMCNHVFSNGNIYIYRAVRRNIQEPRFNMVHRWKSQSPPSSTPFVSRRAGHSHSMSALLFHSSAATTVAASCSPVQCLGPISLTISDAFHARSQQPCIISNS
jgi:hypothetical protein